MLHTLLAIIILALGLVAFLMWKVWKAIRAMDLNLTAIFDDSFTQKLAKFTEAKWKRDGKPWNEVDKNGTVRTKVLKRDF